MKTIITILLLASAVVSFGQVAPQGLQQPVTVRVATEVEELARGYAAAFSSITRTPIYMNLRREGTATTLASVKSVKASAGVLIVEDDKGLIYILNPKDVVMITDATPKKDS